VWLWRLLLPQSVFSLLRTTPATDPNPQPSSPALMFKIHQPRGPDRLRPCLRGLQEYPPVTSVMPRLPFYPPLNNHQQRACIRVVIYPFHHVFHFLHVTRPLTLLGGGRVVSCRVSGVQFVQYFAQLVGGRPDRAVDFGLVPDGVGQFP
jgi:hypothetical protein